MQGIDDVGRRACRRCEAEKCAELITGIELGDRRDCRPRLVPLARRNAERHDLSAVDMARARNVLHEEHLELTPHQVCDCVADGLIGHGGHRDPRPRLEEFGGHLRCGVVVPEKHLAWIRIRVRHQIRDRLDAAPRRHDSH